MSRRLDRNGPFPFSSLPSGPRRHRALPNRVPHPPSPVPHGPSKYSGPLPVTLLILPLPRWPPSLPDPPELPLPPRPAQRGSAKPPSGPRGLSSPCSAALGRAPCCALSHTSGTQRVDKIASVLGSLPLPPPTRSRYADTQRTDRRYGASEALGRPVLRKICRNSGQLFGLCSSLTVPGMVLSTQLRSHISNRVAPRSLQVSFLHPPGFSPRRQVGLVISAALLRPGGA